MQNCLKSLYSENFLPLQNPQNNLKIVQNLLFHEVWREQLAKPVQIL
jgi:hypothetical protein